MPRQSKIKVQADDDIEQFESPADASNSKLARSRSGSSDDGSTLYLARIQAEWAKKTRDKEAKALSSSKAEMERHTKQAAELVSEARSEVNELFETFRTNYGVVEQEISDLWSQIIEEIHPFTEAAQHVLACDIQFDKDRSQEHLKGLIYLKKAFNDLTKLTSEVGNLSDDEVEE